MFGLMQDRSHQESDGFRRSAARLREEASRGSDAQLAEKIRKTATEMEQAEVKFWEVQRDARETIRGSREARNSFWRRHSGWTTLLAFAAFLGVAALVNYLTK